MTAPPRTTVTCPVCTHHVQITDGRVGKHYPEGNLCDGYGKSVNGFKVTVENLVTGEIREQFVDAGEYLVLPFPPCYVEAAVWSRTGTVRLTLQDHKPGGVS